MRYLRVLVLTALLLAVGCQAAGTSLNVNGQQGQPITVVSPIPTPPPFRITAVYPVILTTTPNKVGIIAETTGYGGIGITLKISVRNVGGADWQVLKELGVPKFTLVDMPTMDVSKLTPGLYEVKVEARPPTTTDWSMAISRSFFLEVQPSVPAP